MPPQPSNRAPELADVEAILNEELLWLDRVTRDKIDSPAWIERLADSMSEGLDIEKESTEMFIDGARLSMRQALFFCWSALPPARRTTIEANRIVKLALTRRFELANEITRELFGGDVAE